MNEMFEVRNEHLYKTLSFFGLQSNQYITELKICYLGPKVWDILPNIYKNINDLRKFKKAIKKWKHENCPCRICKKYIANVGFIQKTMLELFLAKY